MQKYATLNAHHQQKGVLAMDNLILLFFYIGFLCIGLPLFYYLFLLIQKICQV